MFSSCAWHMADATLTRCFRVNLAAMPTKTPAYDNFRDNVPCVLPSNFAKGYDEKEGNRAGEN